METYTIVNTIDLTQAMIDVCQITSMDTVRKSIDGTLTILKWVGETPAIFVGATVYDNAEANVLMDTPEWTEEQS